MLDAQLILERERERETAGLSLDPILVLRQDGHFVVLYDQRRSRPTHGNARVGAARIAAHYDDGRYRRLVVIVATFERTRSRRRRSAAGSVFIDSVIVFSVTNVCECVISKERERERVCVIISRERDRVCY